MDCNLLGSFVHGIFQARILEWVAISHSRGSSRPRDGPHVSGFSCVGRRHVGSVLPVRALLPALVLWVSQFSSLNLFPRRNSKN